MPSMAKVRKVFSCPLLSPSWILLVLVSKFVTCSLVSDLSIATQNLFRDPGAGQKVVCPSCTASTMAFNAALPSCCFENFLISAEK